LREKSKLHLVLLVKISLCLNRLFLLKKKRKKMKEGSQYFMYDNGWVTIILLARSENLPRRVARSIKKLQLAYGNTNGELRWRNIYTLSHFRLEYWKTNSPPPGRRILFAVLLAFELQSGRILIICPATEVDLRVCIWTGVIRTRRVKHEGKKKISKYRKVFSLIEIFLF